MKQKVFMSIIMMLAISLCGCSSTIDVGVDNIEPDTVIVNLEQNSEDKIEKKSMVAEDIAPYKESLFSIIDWDKYTIQNNDIYIFDKNGNDITIDNISDKTL